VPTISVCVPTRNRAGLLRHCLASIATQTRQPDLVVIGDDDSQDDTAIVVSEYVELFSDRGITTRYFRHPFPLGQEANRRFCFRAAHGEFVAMVDDDDLWRPEFLERMSGALEGTPDAAFASCSQSVIDAAGEILPEESATIDVLSGRNILEAGVYENVAPIVMTGMPFMLGATLFRRRVLAEIGFVPEGSGLVCDWAVMCQIAATGARMVYLPEPLSLYRVHSQGRASDDPAFPRDSYRWARRLFLAASASEYRDLLRAVAIRAHRDFMMELAHSGHKLMAVREAALLARNWGIRALGLRGLVFLPLVLLGADRLRNGRPLPALVPCRGLLEPELRPRRCAVSAF
jgi:glycosyltransferase involved in cell wall biosynthesis